MSFVQAALHLGSRARAMPGVPLPRPADVEPCQPEERCGWFDSSFDLTQGLDVAEQDSDMLYQLWSLSRR